MNQQDQINIIKAHMAGKRVLVNTDPAGGGTTWLPITAAHYAFNFQREVYKIEPRNIELFMALPSGVLQSLGREPACATGAAYIGNQPPDQLQPGHVIVKIHYIEPEN